MIGTAVGPYAILAKLGEGGMGEVYRARDTKLNRDVAVKVLPASVSDDPERLARLEREAQVLASLNHTNIAAIYGLEAGAIVMELVEGATLEDLMAGPASLGVADALAIARQIADALEAAHERGIVHRDLKPSNVKLTADGSVKVLDFGLAKAVDGRSSGAADDHSPTMITPAVTTMGTILGTAAYMSPEQARGKPVDKRADIWAFGVVLYEMLSGQRLFPGETVSDVIAAVLTREVDWSALPIDTPAPVHRLLRRCLDRDPRQRLRDIGEARVGLQPDAAATEAVPPFASRSPGPGRLRGYDPLVLAGTAVAAAALTFVVMSWSTAVPDVSPVAFPLPAPPGTRLEQVTISPDGRSLAFIGESPSGVTNLWVRSLESRDVRRLAGTEGARDLFWSADSQAIGFFTEERLSKIDVRSGAVASVTTTAQSRGGDWNGQDTIVYGGINLERISGDGSDAETALEIDTASGENAIRYPSFLPNGRHVLYYSRNAEHPDKAGLWLVDLDTRVRKHLTPAAASAAVYAEPGYLIYRRDRYLVAHPFDRRSLEFAGDPRTIAEDLWFEPGVTAQTNFSVSRTGTLTFRTGGPEMSDLAWFTRDGRRQELVWEPNSFVTLGLSPDGTQVLTGFPSRGVEREAWLYDPSTGTARQIPTEGDVAGNAVFSPDGTRALIGLFANARFRPWLARLGSGAAPEPLEVAGANAHATDWYGDLVVYEASTATSRPSLHVLDLSSGKDRPLVSGSGNQIFGSVSPDGRWLSYASDEAGQWEVYVSTFPDAEQRWRISTAGGHQPRWNPRGGELFYLAPDRRMMAVSLRGTSGTLRWDAPRPLFQTAIVDLGPYRGSWSYAVSPDGERFLILTRRPQDSSPAVAILNWR
jgi:serine/threonine protein kinase/Tol biopolymer transport system component